MPRKTRVTLVVAACTTAMFHNPVRSEDLSDAQKILEKAATALEGLKTAKYDAEFSGTGWVKQFVADVSGKAMIGPSAEYDVPRFWSEVQLRKGDSDEAMSYTVGCNGDEYYMIDAGSKKAYHDMDPDVMGEESRNLQRLILAEYSAKEPLKDAVASKTAKLGTAEDVGGEPCYAVEVAIEDDQAKTTHYWISKKDFLPRRVKRVYAGRDDNPEDGTTQTTITNLVANPKLPNAAFNLKLPAGYTAIDDFAP